MADIQVVRIPLDGSPPKVLVGDADCDRDPCEKHKRCHCMCPCGQDEREYNCDRCWEMFGDDD